MVFVVGSTPQAGEHDVDLVDALRELVSAAPESERWTVRIDDTWAHADLDEQLPLQGWKLHVSATVRSAEAVLHACAPVLLAARCAFKVARDSRRVQALTSPHCPRGNAGKILTVYPRDDRTAVQLAHRLDEVTKGLDGPRILCDRPLREGALVHYRYGVFRGVPHVSHDGEVSMALLAPDRTRVVDRREAGARPPAWARCPFPSDQPAQDGRRRERQVLLGDRFAVREAIRHANRGGVFRAIDTLTGRPVVVKQARAHVGADADGVDCRDRLRHEAHVLTTLAGTGLLPEHVATFEQGGDLFLAEQDLGGPNLRAWVGAGAQDGVVVRPHRETLQTLAAVATMLARLHDAGVIVRDLNPNNIVMTDGGPVLIDPELAVVPGGRTDLFEQSGTPGYSAPEQFAGAKPASSADLYSLGALLLFAFTGEDPYLGQTGREIALTRWIAHGLRHRAVPAALLDLALALCDTDPAQRPDARHAAAVLGSLPADAAQLTPHAAVRLAIDDVHPIPQRTVDEAIAALTERLLTDIRPGDGRVARASTFGETTLATNVQHGAAGVLGVLVRAGTVLRDEPLLARAREVAAWLEGALARQPSGGPVGLYFGSAGAYWALADAGAALGDAGMIDRAVAGALRVPADFPGPDVTHGVAGLGLTLVHLYRLTGADELRRRVDTIAATLLSSAARDEHGITWRTPPGTKSAFAGSRYHGFAHGTAGIGMFLDYAGRLTGRDVYETAAAEAADALRRAAIQEHGTATWGSSPEDPLPGIPHWCNGSSGVATFLVRHRAGTGDRDLLTAAARAIVAAKWRSGIAYCHGLAGNADLLLDLAAAGIDDRYEQWAGDLLRVMWERREVDDRGAGLTDEPGRITPDFNVGYGGALAALLRYRHGGPRMWLPELPA